MFDEKFRSDGLLVIDRLFRPDLIAAVRAQVEGWTGAIDPQRPPAHMRVGEGRLHMPVRLEGPLLDKDLLFHPLLEGIVGGLLGAEYLIDNLSLVTALPGAPAMKLHRDHPPLFPFDGEVGVLPPYAVTLVVPLIETDAATGTTAVARGSFEAETPDGATLDRAVDWDEPHLPLGGAFLMDVRSWHRGLPNRSARERPLLYAMFTRSWFSDTVNFNVHPRMTITREAFVALDPAQRYRLRRAAAPGLIDDTVEHLGALEGRPPIDEANLA